MRNFYRSIVEFFFPLKKELRLAQQKALALKFEQYFEHLQTRVPKNWDRMTENQKLILTQIINKVNDDDFSYFRFELPSHNPDTAVICDVLKALNGVYDVQDKEYQHDAWEWLYNNIPAFKKRSDLLM
jgi:hypothetical protein